MTTKRKIHPAANIFPMMNGADFEQLKASIEEIGLQEPIVLWKQQVIDGRNRLRACEELGIDPQEAELDDGVDPVAFAIAANQRRRNLTNKSQLAMCAAKMAGLKSGRPTTVPIGTVSDADKLAAEEAGTTFGIGRTPVFRALRVLREGCPKLIAQCENGEVAVSLACKLLDACDTKTDQAKVCKGGRSSIKEYVSAETPIDKQWDTMRKHIRTWADRWGTQTPLDYLEDLVAELRERPSPEPLAEESVA